MKRFHPFLFAWLFCVVVCTPTLFASTWTQIDYPGALNTFVQATNSLGELVGQYQAADGTLHGFLYSSGTYTTVDVPLNLGACTDATGINDAGVIVGYFVAANGEHGFMLSGGNYTVFDPPKSVETVPGQINNSGEIVGYFLDTVGFHGFTDQNGAFNVIDAPGFKNATQLFGVNNLGVLAGYVFVGSILTGLEDTNGKFQPIKYPGAASTSVSGINDHDEIVGTVDQPANNAFPFGFAFHNGKFVRVSYPGSLTTSAMSVNNNGDIAGNFQDQSSAFHGFFWTK